MTVCCTYFRLLRYLLGALATMSAICATARAQDVKALARLVTPAYTAMSYANLCAMNQDWAAAQPRGARGSAIQYAQHVKDEVIASLSYEDAKGVLQIAADAARNSARAELAEKVILTDKAAEAVRFRAWCDGYVKTFIRELIQQHDGDHTAFMGRVELAKSPHAETEHTH